MRLLSRSRNHFLLQPCRLIRHSAIIMGLGAFLASAMCQRSATAQNSNGSATTSDPQAVTFAARTMAALTGGKVIHDVTLTGTVTRDVGGSDTGTVTLSAIGTGESRIDLALSDGTRTEIRDDSTGIPEGKWIAQDGKFGMIAAHNTMTDAVWFFPALGSLTAGPNVVLSYVGQETRDGITVDHIRSYVSQTGQSSIPNLQQLSTMDFYLNAATLLPVSLTFNTHPDNNELANLPVEIDYSNYQTIDGVAIPMHIQRRLQGHLVEDFVVTGAIFNTGLSISAFAID